MSPIESMQAFSVLGSIIEVIVVLIVLILLSRISYYLRHILAELRKTGPTVDLRVKCVACGNPIPRSAIQYIKNEPVCAICYAKVKNKPAPASTTK